jgi:hypothetical protein
MNIIKENYDKGYFIYPSQKHLIDSVREFVKHRDSAIRNGDIKVQQLRAQEKQILQMLVRDRPEQVSKITDHYISHRN